MNQAMKAEFMADVNEITEGMLLEGSCASSVVVRAEGLLDDGVAFSLRGGAQRVAGEWYGRRVKVTVETIDGEE